MTQDPVFSSTVHALLQGHILCSVGFDGYYQYLSQPSHFESVNQFLNQIDRALCQTNDGKGFYIAYLEPEAPSAHKAIREQFKLITGELEPIVQFLRLCRIAQPGAEPISANEPVYESSLLGHIESSGAAQQLLDDLAKSPFVHSKASDSKGQLHMLMLRLVEHGYLVSVGRTGAHYIATAKWSWLYEVMAFIQAHERLSGQDEETDFDQPQEGQTQPLTEAPPLFHDLTHSEVPD